MGGGYPPKLTFFVQLQPVSQLLFTWVVKSAPSWVRGPRGKNAEPDPFINRVENVVLHPMPPEIRKGQEFQTPSKFWLLSNDSVT